MRKKDFELIVLIILVAIGSVFLWFSVTSNIPAIYNKEYIKPYSIPNIVILMLLVGCLVLLFFNLLGRRKEEINTSNQPEINDISKDKSDSKLYMGESLQSKVLTFALSDKNKILLTSLMIAIYVFSWPFLGFLLSSFIFVFVLSLILPKRKSVLLALFNALGTVVICYVFFIKLFSINLPKLF